MQQGKWHYLHNLITAYKNNIVLSFSYFNREIRLLIKCKQTLNKSKQPMTAGLTLKFSKAYVSTSGNWGGDPNRYPVSQSSLRESPFAATNSTCQDTERISLISDASYLLLLFSSFLSQQQQQQGQLQLSDQRALWEISSQFIMQLCPTGQLKFLGELLHGCQIGKCWSSKTQRGPKNSDLFGPSQNRSRCRMCTVSMKHLPAVII